MGRVNPRLTRWCVRAGVDIARPTIGGAIHLRWALPRSIRWRDQHGCSIVAIVVPIVGLVRVGAGKITAERAHRSGTKLGSIARSSVAVGVQKMQHLA